MSLYSTSGGIRLGQDANLVQPLLAHATGTPERPLLAVRRADGFADVSAADVWARVCALANRLVGLGVEPGDRVAIIGGNRPEWLLLDYAVLAAGGVTVPVPTNSPPDRTAWVLADAGVVVIAFGEGVSAETREVAGASPTTRGRVIELDGLSRLVEAGQGDGDGELERRLDRLGTNTLATILYTSGTTGRSKGCLLTHGNLRSNAVNLLAALDGRLGDGETQLLNIPLAFSHGRMLAFLAVEHGMRLALASPAGTLTDEVSMVRPTYGEVGVVTAVLAHLRNHEPDGGRQFDAALTTAARHSREAVIGQVGLATVSLQNVFEPVYERIRMALGGRLRTCHSAGGPGDAWLVHALRTIGIEVYAGYGMSEASPVLTMNRPSARRIGTSGQPLPGTTIRIADDGEIHARGPQVFHGYVSNPDATRTALAEDGWLRTGDLGALDDDGYLTVEVRKSEIITLTSGATVVPSRVEARLERHPAIHRAVAFGEGQPHLVALVVPADRSADHGVVAAAVEAASRDSPPDEQIRAVQLLHRDLDVATGELTPTGKLRRGEIAARHSEVIEGLVRGGGGASSRAVARHSSGGRFLLKPPMDVEAASAPMER